MKNPFRHLMISLSLSAIALLAMAVTVSAQVTIPMEPSNQTVAASSVAAGTFAPQVMRIVPVSDVDASTLTQMVSSIDTTIASDWGWRPSKPTTVFLYQDGASLVNAFVSFGGPALAATHREMLANTQAILLPPGTSDSSYSILVNVGKGYPSFFWEPTTQWQTNVAMSITQEYVRLMERDMGAATGPLWLREGLANVVAYTMVRHSTDESSQNDYARYAESSPTTLTNLGDLGQVPTWNALLGNSLQSHEKAEGISSLSVLYLANTFGGRPLLNILQRTGAGEDFETVFRSVTGLSIAQADTQYKLSVFGPPPPARRN